MIASMLGATIGVPYLASHLPSANRSASTPPTTASPFAAASSTTTQRLPPTGRPDSSLYANPAPLEGPRVHSLEQVLRFDLTKDWVYRNWARKSTGPTDVGLFAVRVPLVTGTHVSSVAGSLTYYFNSHDQIEHISFHGRTGDTTQLVRFLAYAYQFQPTAGQPGEQLYQVKRGKRIQSELRTHSAPVVWATSPHSSIAVELELARPGSKRFLPPRGPALQIPQAASTQFEGQVR
jgi:hypothetical protein